MSEPSTSPADCPACGTPLPEGAPASRCPRCLMAAIIDPTREGDGVAPLAPLSPEELGPYFPQLEILECLGRGGMGVVYKARQKSLNRLVALKLLAPERAGDPAFARRFEKEAQALAALGHPNIVAIHDFGEAGGFYYLLMEYIDGVNLRQLLATRRLTPREALAIVPPVCEALQCAHDRGIVHRDIKPENLLIDKSGAVKIADFGIAKMLDVAAESPESVAAGPGSLPLGTPGYAAPEQAGGHADHRADIYSLGVVLYEMLTGERPKERIEAPSRRVQVDVRIDEIVLRALEKTPELRFATAAEFRTQVEAVSTIADPGRPAAPPAGLLKLCTSTLSTPAALRTIRGQLAILQTRGQLILDDRQLSHTRVGRTTVIPLAAIRDVSLGQYPRTMNAAGVSMVSVSYEEGGERKQVLLSPMEGMFAFPSTWNALAADWHAAIRAAVKAATGAEPATTPADRLGIAGGFPWSLVLPVVPLLVGVGLYLTLLRPTGAPFPAPILFFGIFTMVYIGAAFVIPWAMGRLGQTDTREKGDSSVPVNRSMWKKLAMIVLLAPLAIHFGSLALRAVSPDAWPDSGAAFFPLRPEMLFLATLSALLFWFWSGCDGSVRWHHQVALAGVWWFLSLPILFWLADVPRTQNTLELPRWLMVGAVPPLLVLAKRQLRRCQATPDAARWLRAWSWVGWCLAVPAIAYAAYFLHSMANEIGGWHPSPGEALAVPLICLAALMLPGCSADLWRAANDGKMSLVFMAMAALSATAVMVLSLSGGTAAKPSLPGGTTVPDAAHVSRNGKAMLVHQDNAEVHHILFAPRGGSSTVSDSRNTHSLVWLETGSIKTGEGRTFSYLRESRSPHELKVNGEAFDLRRGKVLVLLPDGRVEQIRLFPSPADATDPELIATQTERVREIYSSPLTDEKRRSQLDIARQQLASLRKIYAPTHPIILEYQEQIDSLGVTISQITPEKIQDEPTEGLALFAPETGAGISATEFRAVTTICNPRHVAVLTVEAESPAGKDILAGQSYYFVALDDSAPLSTTTSWQAETGADGLVSFRLTVDSQHAQSHWIDSGGPVDWLKGFQWTASRLPRSYWVGPSEWQLSDTNTISLFEGVKPDDPLQKAVIRLLFGLHPLPDGFQPAESGRVIQLGTQWRTDLSLSADESPLPQVGRFGDQKKPSNQPK